MGQHMRFWCVSHFLASKAQASLSKCTDSPVPSLRTYINMSEDESSAEISAGSTSL